MHAAAADDHSFLPRRARQNDPPRQLREQTLTVRNDTGYSERCRKSPRSATDRARWPTSG